MKILLIDNYDSFTFNLAQYVEETLGYPPDISFNDCIDLRHASRYDKILLSPGPGVPAQAGLMCRLIRELAAYKSILGICLGMQAIGEVFGAKLENLSVVFHGRSLPVKIKDFDEVLFRHLPHTFPVGRYHSWVVSKNSLPDCLVVTCEDEQGYIMGIRHRLYDVRGVQFHPESVMTPHGFQIIKNWLKS